MIHFWEHKTLTEMTPGEWESLCDGCGQCCLHKLVNEETTDVFYTHVACRLLNTETARCQGYAMRRETVSDCLDVRSMDASELAWMPRSCAYRRLSEGKIAAAMASTADRRSAIGAQRRRECRQQNHQRRRR